MSNQTTPHPGPNSALSSATEPASTLLAPARRDGKAFLNPVPTALGGTSMFLKVMPLYLRSQAERTPRTPLGPFPTDPAAYSTDPSTGLRVTWFGHSGLLLELDGVRILVDPIWELRASPRQWFGPRRFFPPTLALRDLPQIDVVLLSHDHYDHLGEFTARELATLPCAARARWVTSLGVGAILSSFGVPAASITELDWTETTAVTSPRTGATVEIRALPARHFSGRSLFNRFETLWSSFLLQGAQHRVYFGADSGPWPGFREIGERFGPFDLTLLEIGAYNELWGDIHLGPDHAAEAFQQLGGTGLFMPIHWGLFDLALHAWREPIERLRTVAAEANLPLWSPRPGTPTDVIPNTPLLDPWWHGKGREAASPQPTEAAVAPLTGMVRD